MLSHGSLNMKERDRPFKQYCKESNPHLKLTKSAISLKMFEILSHLK